MKIIKNEKLIKRNSKIGQYTSLGALVVLVLLGSVEPAEAFMGLGHPAVITVAAVLVISQALANAGLSPGDVVELLPPFAGG